MILLQWGITVYYRVKYKKSVVQLQGNRILYPFCLAGYVQCIMRNILKNNHYNNAK